MKTKQTTVQQMYRQCRRIYRMTMKLNDTKLRMEAVNALRTLTGRWDAGFGPPKSGLNLTQKAFCGQFYYVRFVDVVGGRYEKFRESKLHGTYVMWKPNTARAAFAKWAGQDRNDKFGNDLMQKLWKEFLYCGMWSPDLVAGGVMWHRNPDCCAPHGLHREFQVWLEQKASA